MSNEYDEDEPKSKDPYIVGPSHILNGYKELQKKEEYFFMKSSKSKFIDLENELQGKNSYFCRSKVPQINKYDIEIQKKQDELKYKSASRIDYSFCQKCIKNRNFCPHKNQRELIKDKYSYPILTSNAYGWLPEYDNFKENHRLGSQTKDFFDNTHL